MHLRGRAISKYCLKISSTSKDASIPMQMKPNIGLRSEDNTRLRKLVQETARDVVKVRNLKCLHLICHSHFLILDLVVDIGQAYYEQMLQAMNRLQEPLSRDMLTEAYLREIRSAHSKEVEKKERRKSSPNLYKKVKR